MEHGLNDFPSQAALDVADDPRAYSIRLGGAHAARASERDNRAELKEHIKDALKRRQQLAGS